MDKIDATGFEWSDGGLLSYAIPFDGWVLVTVVKNGSDFTYYADGTPVTSDFNANTAGNTPFYIGGDPAAPGDGFTSGLIDEVRLYNRRSVRPKSQSSTKAALSK